MKTVNINPEDGKLDIPNFMDNSLFYFTLKRKYIYIYYRITRQVAMLSLLESHRVTRDKVLDMH